MLGGFEVLMIIGDRLEAPKKERKKWKENSD